MSEKKGYYDFDIDIDVFIQNGCLEDLFWLQDLKLRKLYLNYDIDQSNIHEIVRHILQINAEDAGLDPSERKPILLYVVSNGGEVDSGFELIDVIRASKTPVYTINLGYQYSMGFLIGIAGHKRFAMHNAKFLIHDGSNFVYGSGNKGQDQIAFNRRVEERIREYILSSSTLEGEAREALEKEYDSKVRVEWYMFADEAKEKGFTDYIIGEDCDLNDII